MYVARRPLTASLALVVLLVSFGADAKDTKKQCAMSANHGQELRGKHRLLEARAEFVRCGADTCPAIVAKDCAQWLSELETRIPTVVFSATDPLGKDVADLNVSVDGSRFDLGVPGTAVPIDPGRHKVRYEAPGLNALEEDLLIVEGERARSVRAKLRRPGDDLAEVRTNVAPPPPRLHGSSAAAVYVLGGIGLVGIGSFVGFGLSGKSEYSDLEGRCAPRCSPEETSSVSTKFTIADISLGVGIASLAAASIVLAIHLSGSSKSSEPKASLSLVPQKSGALGGIQGTF